MMSWPWTAGSVLCILIFSLIFTARTHCIRRALVALITYLTSISPPALLYLCVLDLEALTARYHSIFSELSDLRLHGNIDLVRVTSVLEDRHQAELAHLQRSVARLSDLLDESREREARQKRRVQRKVGEERKLSSALSEQLTIAHASSAQARRRVLEISQLCNRVQGCSARLRAENAELRAVGGEVLDDNERLLSELYHAEREVLRHREEITRVEAALKDQEASARNTETSLREQLDRLKTSFASLEDIVDDARAELVECKGELVDLKARLARLPTICDDDVSDFELEKTLFDASEPDTFRWVSNDSGPCPRKYGSESSAPSLAYLVRDDTSPDSDIDELRSTLDRLRSLLPTTVTVRVVAIPPPSSSSLAALDLAYRRAADHLSYDDLLALDFPSFSSLSSFDGDRCNFTPSFRIGSLAKPLLEEVAPLSNLISSESQPSSSTSAPLLPLSTDTLKPELDPFDADPMLAIPIFRLTHSAPPSPRRKTRYAQDLEHLCLQKSTSLPRALDELAPGLMNLGTRARKVEKLLDVKMPISEPRSKPNRAPHDVGRSHTRACTLPAAPSSSSTTSLPLFASWDTPPEPDDPFTTDPMLAIPFFRLISSAPPTPKRMFRSDKLLERMTMRPSTSMPEPLDEILTEYDVDVDASKRKRKGLAWEGMILDEMVPWGSGSVGSASWDEFDAVGVPPIPRSAGCGVDRI